MDHQPFEEEPLEAVKTAENSGASNYVPTVTEEDLIDFHKCHFTTLACPREFPENYDTDDGDDLGYYPDGSKRTLTDEQIAIFRHSEIQELLKIHRAAVDDGIPSPFAGLGTTVRAETVGKPAPQDYDFPSDNADYPKTQTSRTDESLPARSSSQKSTTGSLGQNKRKRKPKAKKMEYVRHDPQRYKTDGEERTFRRIAREMDCQKESAVELDY